MVNTTLSSQFSLIGKNLSIGYDDKILAENLDISLPKGKISVLLGRNGCGKSTLLRSLARLLKIKEGQIILEGDLLHTLKTKEVAKRLALLPQSPPTPEGLTVEELVRFGRHPYHHFLSSKNDQEKDRTIVHWAMQATNVFDLKDRSLEELSGGQRQRAWLALALAQETPTLFLDEPTTFLDLCYQYEILNLLKDLNQNYGKTILMVLHDINLAALYADKIFVVEEGRISHHGHPEEILDGPLIEKIFGVKAQKIYHPVKNKPQFLFL